MLDLLFENLKNYNISPNAFYVLYCMQNSETPVNVNVHLETRALEKEGLLTTDYKLNDKSIELLKDFSKDKPPSKAVNKKVMSPIDMQFIEMYNEIFPKMKLPSEKHARSEPIELQENFKWFFSKYHYSWTTVLKATELMVKEKRESKKEGEKLFQYMRTSKYFIKKMEKDKGTFSELAQYCYTVESGYTEPEVIAEPIFKLNVFGRK